MTQSCYWTQFIQQDITNTIYSINTTTTHVHNTCYSTCTQYMLQYMYTIHVTVHVHNTCYSTCTQYMLQYMLHYMLQYMYTIHVTVHVHNTCYSTCTQYMLHTCKWRTPPLGLKAVLPCSIRLLLKVSVCPGCSL